MLAALVFLPKVWRRTPEGFTPVVKISVLDMLQARSYHKSALKLESEGKTRLAITEWGNAAGNDPCDLVLLRGNLQSIVKWDKLNEFGPGALNQAFWLLRIGGTNMADVELTAQICRTAKAPKLLEALLEPLRDKWTPQLRAAWVKSAFDSERWPEVGTEIAKGGLDESDEELKIYIAAWQAAFGESNNSGPAKDFLKSMLKNSKWQVLAHHLSLVSSASRDDLAEYDPILKQLQLWKEDQPDEHFRYWRMLLGAGKKDEAQEALRSYPEPLESSAVLFKLVDFFVQMKERAFAIGLCRKYQHQFDLLPAFWTLYAQQVIETRDPDQMEAVLNEMRLTPGVRDELEGFGYFFEARMELIKGRIPKAEALFAKAGDAEYRDANIGVRIADELLQINHPKEAGKIYQRLESSFADRAEFWVNVMRVADQIKDLDLIYRASEKAYRLRTNDVSLMNFFVAASLMKRTNIVEVDRLTQALISQNPGSVAVQVNRGASLVLSERAPEALALLQAVDISKLKREEQSFFRLDLLEALMANKERSKASQISRLIEPLVLYPQQAERLKQLRAELEKN